MSDNWSNHVTPVQGDVQIGKIGFNLRGQRDAVVTTHSRSGHTMNSNICSTKLQTLHYIFSSLYQLLHVRSTTITPAHYEQESVHTQLEPSNASLNLIMSRREQCLRRFRTATTTLSAR